jgi:hypothetical protein
MKLSTESLEEIWKIQEKCSNKLIEISNDVLSLLNKVNEKNEEYQKDNGHLFVDSWLAQEPTDFIKGMAELSSLIKSFSDQD